ncbi:MAG: hypothetical protein SFY81_04865 [Verrucomicrobiota bacterium]|nr:hypothetical protein [Verrucomicrobiota bacterium]
MLLKTNESAAMRKKEKFLMYVYFGAMAKDIENDTADTPMILNFANRITEEKIPPQEGNAAKVFLSFVGGKNSSEFKWMHCFDEAESA